MISSEHTHPFIIKVEKNKTSNTSQLYKERVCDQKVMN